MEHIFTKDIKRILIDEFEDKAEIIYSLCPILQYINLKTKSVDRSSKSRSNYGNLYAIYVLVEDYVKKGFNKSGKYKDYEGARFKDLFMRQRELPFGEKLQNHALNHRLNEEFRKYFPTLNYEPIIRDTQENKYWFNENLLICRIDNQEYNIAVSIIKIIDEYIERKQKAFINFIKYCEQIMGFQYTENQLAVNFVIELLSPNVDARIFEIVSYSILKYYYHNQTVFFGFDLKSLKQENLILYKTGRTNANDGGIDFVMRPTGRFFQVTETTDIKKYFLDIDKVERYPITFVIKSNEDIRELRDKIREKASEQYPINAIVEKYMNCIEELINLPILIQYFKKENNAGYLKDIVNEIVKQSKLEFNYESY